MELIDVRPGMATFQVDGPQADVLFKDEHGGHRWQGPSGGQVHTSTVTVAVLPEAKPCDVQVLDRDLEWSATTSQGNGGQSVNTTYSCVILKHKPSGMVIRCQNERSQQQNRRYALAILRSRLASQQKERADSERAHARKQQLGSGQRGDKRRTIRTQDGQVKDHVTGRTWRYSDYREGKW